MNSKNINTELFPPSHKTYRSAAFSASSDRISHQVHINISATRKTAPKDQIQVYQTCIHLKHKPTVNRLHEIIQIIWVN